MKFNETNQKIKFMKFNEINQKTNDSNYKFHWNFPKYNWNK